VADGVHDGVVDGVGLGEDGAPDGEKRSDNGLVEHASPVDDEVGGPGHEPQGDGHESNLAQTALSRGLLGFLASQRLDSHLLGLFSHSLLVSSNSLDDEGVAVDDVGKREKIYPYRVDVQIAPGEFSLSQVVSTTGKHVTLRYISVPSEEGRKAPGKSESPSASNPHHSTTRCERFSRHSLDDDVVSVGSDEDHGPDGHAAEEGTQESVDLTEECAENPCSPVSVDQKRRSHGKHHEEVGDGQVDDKQVGGCSQTLGIHEYPDDYEVTSYRQCSHDSHPEAEKTIPERIHGRELIPVGVYHMEHALWHCIYHCIVPIRIGGWKDSVLDWTVPRRHLQ